MTQDISQIGYLAVEGPIGVGKTSLAELLADDYGANTVFEDSDDNPFLPLFYSDPARFSFHVQLSFLMSRYKQQLELKQKNLFNEQLVCNYVFAKDLVFANINLSPEEYELYSQIYRLLDSRLPKPDVVILLQANPDVLLKRIRKRGLSHESGITAEYIEKVSQAYSQFFFQYTDAPLLVVNTSGIDFVNEPRDYEMLKKELFYLIKSGHEKHFVTLDSR